MVRIKIREGFRLGFMFGVYGFGARLWNLEIWGDEHTWYSSMFIRKPLCWSYLIGEREGERGLKCLCSGEWLRVERDGLRVERGREIEREWIMSISWSFSCFDLSPLPLPGTRGRALSVLLAYLGCVDLGLIWIPPWWSPCAFSLSLLIVW